MKIYFAAAKKYKKEYESIYERIVSCLSSQDHEVFTKVLSEKAPEPSQTTIYKVKQWFIEWSSYIRECDFALFEVSYPSTAHIGFEIGMALLKGKTVVVLFKENNDPIFINSLYSQRVIKSEYSENTLEETLTWCIEEVKKTINRRFTFFISPEIDQFLDQIAKKGGSTKSEYIRNLIEEKRRQADQ